MRWIIALAAFFLAAPLFAQIDQPIQFVTSSPTGACTPGTRVQFNYSVAVTLWGCGSDNAWHQITGGGGGGGTLIVGTTPISGGTPGNIEMNNGGVLGEFGTTGTGNVIRASAVCPIIGSPAINSVATDNGSGCPQDSTATYTSLGFNVPGGASYFINSLPIGQAQTGLFNFYLGASGNLTGSGGSNSALGYRSLFLVTSGSSNTGIGSAALGATTTGSGNSSVGIAALSGNTLGSFNSALGAGAGVTATAGNTNVSGSNNTYIGYQCGASTPSQLSNSFCLGSGALFAASNAGVIGNSSVTDVYFGGLTAQAVAHALGVSLTGTSSGVTKLVSANAGATNYTITVPNPSGSADTVCLLTLANCGSGGSSAFSGLTSGTNTTAAMVVGTGASLAPTGAGTIGATSVPASGVTAGTFPSGISAANLTSIPLPPNCVQITGTSPFTMTFGPGIPCNYISISGPATIILPASPAYSKAELWINYTGSATTNPALGMLTWNCPSTACSGSLPTAPDLTSSPAVSIVYISYNSPLTAWGGSIVSQSNGALSLGSVPCSQGSAGPFIACSISSVFPGNANTATSAANLSSYPGVCPGVSSGLSSGSNNCSTSHNVAAPRICTGSASSSAQTCTTTPSFTPSAGDELIFIPGSCSGTCSSSFTLAVNGGSAAGVFKWGGSTSVAAGDIVSSKPFKIVFDAAGDWDVDDIGNAPSGSGVNIFSPTTLQGYDDFCLFSNSFSTPGPFSAKQQYYFSSSSGGQSATALLPSCGIQLTTAATSTFNSFIYFSNFATPAPSTTVSKYFVVFSTGDAAHASFAFSLGNDNTVLTGGTANGISIQALAGGSNITMETCVSSVCTSTSSGVAYAANTIYKATMTTNGTGNACIQVTQGITVGSTVCAAAPASAPSANFAIMGVSTNTSVAESAKIYYWAYQVPGY